MRILVVEALDASPFTVLILDLIWLLWPAVSANLRNNLMVVLETPLLGSVLISFAVKHERVHRALDLARVLAFFDLFPSHFGGSIDVRFDVTNNNVLELLRQFAQGLVKFGDLLLCFDLFLLNLLRLRRFLNTRSSFRHRS